MALILEQGSMLNAPNIKILIFVCIWLGVSSPEYIGRLSVCEEDVLHVYLHTCTFANYYIQSLYSHFFVWLRYLRLSGKVVKIIRQ